MNKRILIIDDEAHIRRMMRFTLEAAGYAVKEAHDGPEGLKLYGNGSSWDGVVLDQRMPGTDGLETLRRIKESNPRARVVMATAYASIELAVDAMKLGATDFLRKPMTPETLRNAVAVALTKERQEPAAFEQPVPPLQEAPSVPVIQTITMNGFTILDPAREEWHLPEQRRFTVINPTGSQHDVMVQIDDEVLGYVVRLTRKHLPVESSFWTTQARRLLSDFLWKKGEVPRMNTLTLREISRDELSVAERWREE